MVMNDTKIYQKMKNKGLLSLEKNIKWEKRPYYNYEKLFSFTESTIIFKSNDEEYIKTKYHDNFWKHNFEAINLLQKGGLNIKIWNL